MIVVPAWFVPPLMRLLRYNEHYATRQAAEAHLASLAGWTREAVPPKRLRRDVRITTGEWRGRPIHRLAPVGREPAGTVVYLHGGAWVHDIHVEHWRLAAEMVATVGVDVRLLLYPLLPEGGTAGATAELVADLVRELGPRTVLAGDSAGAQIAFSAALRLRDEGWVVPRTILISPPIDLELIHDDLESRAPLDPWLARDGILVYSTRWVGDRGFEDPMLNPIKADPSGLGPLTIFTGTYDVLNLHVGEWVARLRAAGVEVDLHEERGQVHVYPLVPTRAGRRARGQIMSAVREAFVAR